MGGWNAGVVRELMQAPPPRAPRPPPSNSTGSAARRAALPPRPPLPPQRVSARRSQTNEAAVALELMEMREELMTDQRLIAELAQAALLPFVGEQIAA